MTTLMKQRFFVFLTALLLSACSRTMPPAEVEYDQTISPYHTIQRGESISSVARRYRMDKMELIRINGLKQPYRIVIGQRLLVRPVASSAKIGQTRLDPMETPAAAAPTQMGDVQVSSLQPLPGTEAPAVEPGPQGIPPAVSETGAPLTQEVAPESDADNKENTEISDADDKKAKALPTVPESERTFRLPIQGKIIRGFTPGKNGNDGLNIRAPKGTPVSASNNGVVAHAGNQLRGFGNVVLIKHDNGLMSVYAHLDEVSVKRGDVIQSGQKVGTVGKSGTVKEPQLHFEIRKGTTPVDPNQYLG